MSQLDTINELGPDKTELLYSETISGELLTIRQYQSYRWLSVGGEMIQSLMDVDHPQDLLLPNLKAMLEVFNFVDSPHSVLNLGAGAGSIQRYLSNTHPELVTVSVECNSAVVALAERFFNMQKNDFVIDSAEHFLDMNQERFDVLLVDIYSNEKQPQCLYQSGFYESMAKATTAHSALAFNLLPESEEDLLEILRPLNKHVAWILLHEVPNHDNVIIYALRDDAIPPEKVYESIARLSKHDIELEIIARNA